MRKKNGPEPAAPELVEGAVAELVEAPRNRSAGGSECGNSSNYLYLCSGFPS